MQQSLLRHNGFEAVEKIKISVKMSDRPFMDISMLEMNALKIIGNQRNGHDYTDNMFILP